MGKAAILEALESANESDLEAVDNQIKKTQQQLNSLLMVQKIMCAVLGKEAPAKKHPSANGRGKKAGAGDGRTLRFKRNAAAKYLLHAGTTRASLLANQIGLDQELAPSLLDHEWFEETTAGVCLSSEGRRHWDTEG